MNFVITLLIILAIGALLGALFGWIALFQVRAARRDVRDLRSEITRLRQSTTSKGDAPATLGEPRTAPPKSTPAQTTSAPFVPPPTPADKPSADQAPPTPAPPPRAKAASMAPARTARAATAATPGPNLFAALERSLAGNWLVWVASIAMALGGVFLVKYALDQGLLGPAARVVAAAAAGAAMVAAGEWLRRKGFADGPLGHSAAPAATAGAGLIVLYGAVYAAFGLYELIPAPVAFIALATVAAGAVGLALVHGPALVALGLIGAFAAPLLIGSDAPNAPGLFAYVFAVAVGGLAVTRLVGRRWPAFIALAGGAIWPLLWLSAAYQGDQAWALALYLPALLAAALAFAWEHAGAAPQTSATKELVTQAPVSLVAAYLAAIAVFTLLWMLADTSGHLTVVIIAEGVACAAAMAVAWRREGFIGLPIIAAGGAALVAYSWPSANTGIIDSQIELARAIGVPDAGPDGPPYLATLIAFAALFGLGGLVAQDRLQVKGVMATVSAGAPGVLLAIGFWRVTGLEQDPRWAMAAATLALFCVLLLERIARRAASPEHAAGVDAEPGPASAYALGAMAAAGMAVGMALDQLWMSVGFAVIAPMSALLHRRFKLAPLTWAALAFGILATTRLTIFGEVFNYNVGATPIFNWLLWGYGVPILALWGAARVFERNGLPRAGRVVQAMEAGALVLGVAFISMEIRHLLNGGNLSANYFNSLLEAALHTSAWLGAALALRWRLGPKLYFVQRWAERGLIALALTHIVFVHMLIINPWWGSSPVPVTGPALFNVLALAFALPGALAATYAVIARRQGLTRIGTASGLAGVAMMFTWVTLEVRHAFHGSTLDSGWVVDPENYAYSTIWTVFAFVLLGLGVLRRRPSLRYAALAVLIVVTLKVFGFDMRDLTGALRGISFIGLGAALMAIALLYQRVIPRLTAAPPRPETPASD